MTVIVCLDNANGMMFNHRRQSRDANVVKDILKTINGASLLIAPYSEPLFSQAECSVSVSDSFLIDAGAEDYCFVENITFEQIFEVMFETHIRAISTAEGIAYFEMRKAEVTGKNNI